MTDTDNRLIPQKLALFESHLRHAWMKHLDDDRVEVISDTTGLEMMQPGSKHEINDLIHKLDSVRMKEHFAQLGESISKIQFTLLNAEDNNMKFIASSRRTKDGILSLWIVLPDESKSLGLLAIAAHDMRSPVSSIIGLVNLINMMMMDGAIPNEELTNLMDMIKVSSSKALQLTDEILELADMESEGYALNAKPIVMKDFIAQYISSHSSFKRKKRIEIVLESKTDAKCEINEIKVTRVLDNLLSNAAKFSYPDSQIEIIVEEAAGRVLVKVKDHGVGMPQEMIDEIFVKFGKAQRQGLEGEDSHGLGMSIVKQIMNLHGGDITVESVERVGTTMNLYFKKYKEI